MRAALRGTVIVTVLVEKSLGLHRQMHLVLELRIAIGGEQPGIVCNRLEQRLDPGPIVLGEIGEHVSVHDILQIWMARAQPVARMTYAQPYPAIIVAEMRGDRPEPVVAGIAASNFDSH